MYRLHVWTYGWTQRHGAWRPAPHRPWLTVLLACLIAAGSSLTLAPRPAAAQSICVNKTTTNGLGNNNVNGVYVVGSTVYAATNGGVSISTNGGASFTNYTTTNGLGNNNVKGVYAVGSTVYAATLSGLSISTDGGANYTNKTTANGLGTNSLKGVYAVGSTVYVATNNFGLSISTVGGASFTNYTTANGLGNNIVQGVYAVGSTVYAGTSGGLSISTVGGASFTNYTTANGLGFNSVQGVYAVGSTVYAATALGLSISIDGGANYTNKTTTNGLGGNTVRSVYAVGSTVYAATSGGLSISTDGGASFTNYTTANGLGFNLVQGVYAVGSTVYAATSGGLSICTLPQPVSQVQGNGVTIANGDSTPSSADNTDFGTVLVGSALTRTFTLNNTGTATLTLSALAPSGAAASAFGVTGLSLPATIAASGSATFNVKFTPSATGLYTTTLSLTTNDNTNNPYTFAVQGAGAQALQPTSQLTQQGSASYVGLCTGSYPSRNCTLAFTLKNTSGGPLQIRYEQITAIGSSGNTVVVLNGTPSPGGVNTVVNDVQRVANDATFQPTFQLRLSSNQAYTLRFKVYGYAVSSVTAAGAAQAQAVELGEYAATVTPDTVGHISVFLPVIQR